MINKLARSITITILLLTTLFIAQVSKSQANESGNMNSIEIPDIGVSAPIVSAPLETNTWKVDHLNRNVGYLENLPWFGMDNNVSLAGHVTDEDGNASIFYDLEQLTPGSEIIVNANGQNYRYVVSENYSVSANDLRPLYPIYGSRLTLVTCDRNSFNSATAGYDRRIIVVALPVAG